MALAVLSKDIKTGFTQIVEQLRQLTADDLVQVDEEILSRLSSPVTMIPDLAGHLVQAGGKRLRPILTLCAARMLGYQGNKHIPLAAAVELIHGATLLHDDVVDESSLRRGVRTANIIWGNKESVLVGDYIFSRAFELMVVTENMRVLQILSHASSIIAEGEVLQLATQNNLETSKQMYLDVVDAKTAALFSAATHSGAVIASAANETEQALKDFGRHFGIAYQLVDDALDYEGFETKMGKSIGDDFREGKMTLPVIIALSKANAEEQEFWKRTISDGIQHADDFSRAHLYIKRHNGLTETQKLAEDFAAKAKDNLKNLPDNDYSGLLCDLVDSSLSRLN